MTITLGLWQIAGLILLTLIVVGILKRLVILIATAHSLRWSALTQSATILTGRNSSTESLSESGSERPYFTIEGRGPVFDPNEPTFDFFKSNDDGTIEHPLKFPNGTLIHRNINFTTPIMVPENLIYRDAEGKSPLGLDDSVNDRIPFGSSGISPGGVPYTQVVGKGPIAKGRKMIRRK